jgi:hypothetical protein
VVSGGATGVLALIAPFTNPSLEYASIGGYFSNVPDISSITITVAQQETVQQALLDVGLQGYLYNPPQGPIAQNIIYTGPFTTNIDVVYFTNLTPAQITEIKNGGNIYNALGGSDTVTLPNANPTDTSFSIPGTSVSFNFNRHLFLAIIVPIIFLP